MRWKQGAAQRALIQFKCGCAAVHGGRIANSLNVWEGLVQIARPASCTLAAARVNRHRRAHSCGEVAGQIDDEQRMCALKYGQPGRLKRTIDTTRRLKKFGETGLRVGCCVIDASPLRHGCSGGRRYVVIPSRVQWSKIPKGIPRDPIAAGSVIHPREWSTGRYRKQGGF